MFFYFQKIFIIFLTFVVICFMGVTFSFDSMDMNDTSLLEEGISKYIFSNSGLIWPTPGYTTITSYFGYRKSPISGASSYHNGIDIGAPSGSEIIAAFSGQVTYIGFYGAGGYTVQISDGYYTANYSHISPYFLVYVNQAINQGDVIATVGPKNVYGVPNNKYKDSKGNPTNGATTGPHLHFSLYINGKSVNPLNYLPY